MTRGGDMIPPLVKGVGLTLLPRSEKIYISVGLCIPTEYLAGTDDMTLWNLRKQVAKGIEEQFTLMRDYRAADMPAHWSYLRRLLTTSGDTQHE